MPLNPQQRQTLVWAAVGLLLLWVLSTLGQVLTPFVAGGILAYVLQPGVALLARHRVPRPVGVTLVMLLTLLVLVAITLVLVPIVQTEFGQIRRQFPSLVQAVTERLLPWLKHTFGLDIKLESTDIRAWFSRQLASSGEDWAAAMFAYARTGWSATVQIIGLVFLVPVLTFYLLIDWNDLMARMQAMIPPRWRAPTNDVLGEIDDLLGQYMRGQLLVMLALSVFYSLGLLVAGFSLWLPIGVLTGLLVAIPYLGFALGLVFALITGMLELGPLPGLIATAIVYGLGQLIEGMILTPRLVGERIGLHPLVVILALLAFGTLFGFVGVLMALPLSAMLAVGARRIHRAYLTSEFYARDQ